MSLSANAKRHLVVAVTSQTVGDELAAAIDSNGSGPAAVIAAFGSTTNMSALAPVAASLTALVPTAATFTGAACGGGATPSATDVDTAIDAATAKVKTVVDLKADNSDVEILRTEMLAALLLKADNADGETLRTEAEARLDAIEAKINAILAAMKAAGTMASA